MMVSEGRWLALPMTLVCTCKVCTCKIRPSICLSVSGRFWTFLARRFRWHWQARFDACQNMQPIACPRATALPHRLCVACDIPASLKPLQAVLARPNCNACLFGNVGLRRPRIAIVARVVSQSQQHEATGCEHVRVTNGKNCRYHLDAHASPPSNKLAVTGAGWRGSSNRRGCFHASSIRLQAISK